ncbi:hypothetical protein GLW08_11855 [Pontibacillus yanchengensis]|uniref:Uncharacterized protein n=2 Tax=Pontibacillus yanchengensis TaxID=462910 RepID=A0ACC7VGW9_9BACI|nr:hypothetical protein [Pontibacillus yanchengensis]MYL35544.1 hypothetical protein [Pontibacillus yanchengensis]MYL54032.1 hypothetical protein [Pontibacillus yanchengensis]
MNITKKKIFLTLLITACVISLMVSTILSFQLERVNSQQSDELNQSMESLYNTVESHIKALEEINDIDEYEFNTIQPFLYNSLDAIKNHQMITLTIYSNKSDRKAVKAYKDEFNQLWNVLNEVHNEENNKIENLDNHIKQLKTSLDNFKSYNQGKE